MLFRSNVQAREFRLDQDSRGNAELDGVEFVQALDVVVERRQGQFRNQIKAAGDAGGVGYDLVIGGDKLGAAGAWTGVGVNGGSLEYGVGGDIEGEQRGERASEAVSADGDRGDRSGKG